jgi:hypothetical protein
MAEPIKATLTVLDKQSQQPKGAPLTVHFNPASLSVSYRSSASASGQTAGAPGGSEANPVHRTSTSSSLSLELLFDTTQTGDDVRITTYRIVDEMLAPPQKKPNQNEEAPWVQFQWGTFVYLGMIASLDETLDLFSAEGKPLRSTVRLSLSQVQPPKPQPGGASAGGGGTGGGLGAGLSAGFSAGIGVSAGASIGVSAGASVSLGGSVGTTPLTLAQAGDTLQSLAARAGAGVSWKAIAAANDVDNPRLLQPGAVLDLNARADVSLG